MAKKPGKYAHVIGKLPSLPAENPQYQERVELTKSLIVEPFGATEAPVPAGYLHEKMDLAESTMKEIHQILLRLAPGQPQASRLAHVYAYLRDVKDRLADWESNTNLMLAAVTQMMVEQMDNEGVTQVRLLSGRLISTFPEPYTKVEDKEAFRLWCVEQGLERSMCLPWQSANSLAKQRLLNGEPEPPGVKIYANTAVRLGAE